jgi:hypothetical protein
MKWILVFYLTYAGNDGFSKTGNVPPMVAGNGCLQVMKYGNAHDMRGGTDTLELYIIPDSPHHYIWIDHNKYDLNIPITTKKQQQHEKRN